MKYTLIILCMATLISGATAEINKSYAVEAGTTLEILNVNGAITITRSEKDEIEIFAVKKTKKEEDELDKVKIVITPGKDFVVRTEYPEKYVDVSVDYTIQVPNNVEVKSVETANGTIDINGITGDIEISSANGEIHVNDVNGTIDIELANGEVSVKGSTSIDGIEVANGNISVEIHSITDDEIDISVANGSITVYLSPALDADIEAATAFGKITVHDDIISIEEEDESELEGTIGKGGPTIDMATAIGKIDIRALK